MSTHKKRKDTDARKSRALVPVKDQEETVYKALVAHAENNIVRATYADIAGWTGLSKETQVPARTKALLASGRVHGVIQRGKGGTFIV